MAGGRAGPLAAPGRAAGARSNRARVQRGRPPTRQFLILKPNLSGPRNLVSLKRPGREGKCSQAAGAGWKEKVAYFFASRCITAFNRRGQTMVASLMTSANRPPSSGETNFPQETPSEKVQPLKPPQ